MPDRSRAGVEMASRGRNFRLLTAALLGTSLLGGLPLHPPAACAEVATDGTVGRRTTLRGQDVTVGAELGRRRGGNLFHSFERFGVPTRGSVTFSGPRGVDNVIGRVTGGERSDIDGTLRSTIDGADLYLVNPAGILFGPNARLDVKGSFHASTAGELRFADGAVFSALDPDGSTLSVAEPRAFGFLGVPPAGITVDRSILGARSGDTSLVAGDVLVRGGGTGSSGLVASQGGRLTVVAQGSSGEVALDTGQVSAASSGTLRLSDGAGLLSLNDAGGNAVIRAGRFLLTGGSNVFGATTGATGAEGDVSITAGSISLDGGSFITTGPFAAATGRGADLRIVADQVDVLNGSAISAVPGQSPGARGGDIDVRAGALTVSGGSSGQLTGIFNFPNIPSAPQEGAGGSIDIVASDFRVLSGGSISTRTSGASDAGKISIRADDLLVSGEGAALTAGIQSDAVFGALGRGGAIEIVADNVRLLNGGIVSSQSVAAPGKAGAIFLRARNLLISGDGAPGLTGISTGSLVSPGDAGSVTVDADRISIAGSPGPLSEASISSSTAGGTGTAGTVAVTANERLELRAGGQVSSSTEAGSGGDAGVVTVEAPDLVISGDGATAFTGITSSAFPGSSGAAGSVSVTADRVSVARRDAADRAGITSDTNGGGAAGAVTVVANDRLEVRDGGAVSSSTFNLGAAGTVTVIANELLIDADGYDQFATGIFSQAEPGSSGPAGLVTITGGDLQLRGGGEIASSTFGLGNAGTVLVSADDVLVSSESFQPFATGILSQANPGSPGVAGLVAVVVDEGELEVRGDNALITSRSLGTNNAGGVGVNAPRVVLEDGGSITSESTNGAAGVALVQGDEVVVEDAAIRTSSQNFTGGQIQITANDLISLDNADVTTNGVVPFANRSLITLTAPDIILNASRVTSLTGDGEPLAGSGEALLLGERTVISADSFVAGSSAVEIAGLQQNLGSGLQLPPGAFLDTGRLLRESCAARGGRAARSSFTRASRGGLPPAPDRPLGSAGAEGSVSIGARAGGSEPEFLDLACGGPVVEEMPRS